jgi:hypothetical protein
MKKIILLILVSLIWFSCSLPDSGRMAVIDFNFTQPDILREAETSVVPDRIIPAESKTVVVVMYPSYSDNVTEDSFDSLAEGELGVILNKVETKVLYMSYGKDFSGVSLENIEPGEYSFAVYTFNTIVSNTEEILSNVFSSLTWHIKKDVEIVPGFNLVDLPLKLNGVTQLDVNTANPAIYVSAGLPSETIFLSFTGFEASECTVNFDTSQLGLNAAILTLYNEEGYFINQMTTLTGTSLSFNATGPSFVLIVSAKKTSTVGDTLNIGFNEYISGPDQSVTVSIGIPN